MQFFVIRHKATGQIMPQMLKNRGYSHWNPGNPAAKPVVAAMSVPRLLTSLTQARQVISQWFANPNAYFRGYTSYYGEDDYYVDSKEDGRKKEDLEIVPVTLIYE